MGDSLVLSVLLFGKNCVGIFARPYVTYRGVVDRANLGELGVIGIILWGYFVIASMVKTSLFRPYLLTRQFMVLAVAATFTYLLTVGLFWSAGRLYGSKGNLRGFAVGWGYTMIPTVIWFFMTSLLYVLIPPPRTESAQGIAFSVLYLLISTTLLFWKVTLSYLSLRFGLKLDLGRILKICVLVLPLLGLYSLGMYKLGIFRIPFI